jgi:hypothetical protein
MEKKVAKVFRQEDLKIQGTLSKPQLATLIVSLFGADSSVIKVQGRGDGYDVSVLRYLSSHVIGEEV